MDGPTYIAKEEEGTGSTGEKEGTRKMEERERGKGANINFPFSLLNTPENPNVHSNPKPHIQLGFKPFPHPSDFTGQTTQAQNFNSNPCKNKSLGLVCIHSNPKPHIQPGFKLPSPIRFHGPIHTSQWP